MKNEQRTKFCFLRPSILQNCSQHFSLFIKMVNSGPYYIPWKPLIEYVQGNLTEQVQGLLQCKTFQVKGMMKYIHIIFCLLFPRVADSQKQWFSETLFKRHIGNPKTISTFLKYGFRFRFAQILLLFLNTWYNCKLNNIFHDQLNKNALLNTLRIISSPPP